MTTRAPFQDSISIDNTAGSPALVEEQSPAYEQYTSAKLSNADTATKNTTTYSDLSLNIENYSENKWLFITITGNGAILSVGLQALSSGTDWFDVRTSTGTALVLLTGAEPAASTLRYAIPFSVMGSEIRLSYTETGTSTNATVTAEIWQRAVA